MDKTKILILAANPSDTAKLQLELELLKLELLRQNAKLKESFELKFALAVQDEDLQRALLDFKPDIVHFCGHGEVDGLLLCDKENKKQFVHAEAIKNLFKLFAEQIRCVVLNACYTEEQAEMIREHIDYVVGMKTAIGDDAAIKFATGFYNALFAGEDFSKAYELGCNAIDLANIPEYATPVFKRKSNVFVPSHRYDIAISFTDSDAKWAQNFTEYLRKQLRQKLATADGFQIYSGSELEQLKTSAMLLFVASPDYLAEHQNQLELLKNLVMQKPTFLLEVDTYRLPEGLKGLSRHRFWVDDEAQGIVPLQGDAYIEKTNQVCELIAKKLQELKAQYQSLQRQQEELQQKKSEALKNCHLTTNIDAFVFLHSTHKDLELVKKIEGFLAQYGICCAVSIEALSPDTPADEIRSDRKTNMLNCDAVLVVYENGSLAWARNPLIDYRSIKSLREKEGKSPLKIIAVHKKQGNTELGVKMDNLKIYDCPPEKIEHYLQEFIETLTE